jgi:hypothetical protein
LVAYSADANDDVDTTLVSSNASEQHHAAASGKQRPEVDVYWVDGEIAVIANCAGCLLSVDTLAYTGSQPHSAAPIDFTGHVANDAVDSAWIVADIAKDLPFALVVSLTLVDEVSGAAFEEQHTFFGRTDAAGSFTALTWADFACERGFVSCGFDPALDAVVIDLGLAEHATTDGIEIVEGP